VVLAARVELITEKSKKTGPPEGRGPCFVVARLTALNPRRLLC
jgi:hypothetical protein